MIDESRSLTFEEAFDESEFKMAPHDEIDRTATGCTGSRAIYYGLAGAFLGALSGACTVKVIMGIFIY